MIRLAVIGSSGRKPCDIKILSIKHMEWMASKVLDYIETVLKTTTDDVILVSGGSAWADHIAVQLYLNNNFGGIELYLPSRFDVKNKRYVNTHEGRTLNSLHAKCQEITGMDVFLDLTRINAKKNPNIKIIIKRGFVQRNTLIAQNSNHLIAFTFNEEAPTEGGTYDTWRKFYGDKVHFSLCFVE